MWSAKLAAVAAALFVLVSCQPGGDKERIAQMQLAYDELNSLLVLAEERFKNTTETLEANNQALSKALAALQAVKEENQRMDATRAPNADGPSAREKLPPAEAAGPGPAAPAKSIAKEDSVVTRLVALEKRLQEVALQQAAFAADIEARGNAEIDKALKLLCEKRRK